MQVFRITPKRIKRCNGTVLAPEMVITVTTRIHTADPFYNCAKEIQEMHMNLYGFDYRKACCTKNLWLWDEIRPYQSSCFLHNANRMMIFT